MLHEKYFAYDKLEIPDEIKNMTKEELHAEISCLEKEARVDKEKISCEKAHMGRAV
ncbi:MAG: hypothetical protein ACI4DP_11070 [Candidatus Ornithomonoglobus sp.]